MLKIQEFKTLTDAEATLLYQTPAMIAVLIASADNRIEEEETEWAKKIMGYRQQVGNEMLFPFYDIADTYFDTTLQSLLSNSRGTQAQIAFLEAELAKTTAIFQKLDKDFALNLLNSLKSFGKSVAQATGGLFGLGSISEQETALLELKMIQL
jgi:hypothetical protein